MDFWYYETTIQIIIIVIYSPLNKIVPVYEYERLIEQFCIFINFTNKL